MTSAPFAPRRLLATTAAGCESLLLEELRELGLDVSQTPGGAAELPFDWDAAAIVLVRSRIASRLFLALHEFRAEHAAMLYDEARTVPWTQLMTARHTLAVEVLGSPPQADFSRQFAALKVKDAVCDAFRDEQDQRPSVDRQAPDVQLVAFFHHGRCELSLDLAGEPLHRRGYREEGAAAPIRENRAAALLRFAGYDPARPFCDPFCGSGTLAIEAALIATRRAPGLLRGLRGYAASKLFPEGKAAIEAELARAKRDVRDTPPAPILASDLDGRTVDIARRNAAKAGVAGAIRFAVADARAVTQPGALIAANPPYGERLANPEAARALIDAFTRGLKHGSPDSRLALVLPKGPLETAVGMRPSRKLSVHNGDVELRYLVYDIYAGSRKGAERTPAGTP